LIDSRQDRLSSLKADANKRLYFPNITVRMGVVALLALLLQVLAIEGPLGDAEFLRRALIVSSYVLLLVFVALNIRRPGIAVIGVGLALNFLPIIANEGLMPITAETILKTGPMPEDAAVGKWLPGSKDVLLERDDVRLWFLADRFTWGAVSSVVRAFSIGDVVIGLGLIVTLLDLFAPRLKVRGREKASGESVRH
jgi:hypothetical protein